MRIATALLFLAASFAMSMSFAQSEDQDHSAHHPAPAKEPAAAAEHEHGVSNADLLQENMKKVEALMRQLQMESDPARKRALLSQHMQALREQMRLILAERKPMKMSMNEEGKKDNAAKEGMMRKGGMMGGGMMMMHQKGRAASGHARTVAAAGDRTRGSRSGRVKHRSRFSPSPLVGEG